MKKSETRSLLIGIGNCERGDDGLGWAFLDKIKDWIPEHMDMVYHYQLNVEDAEIIRHYDQVVFIDAFMGDLPNGFDLFECKAKAGSDVTTHEMKPESVLHLCETIYGNAPDAYLFLIKGYDFELGHIITEKAQVNLEKAVQYFEMKMMNPQMDLMASGKKELRMV